MFKTNSRYKILAVILSVMVTDGIGYLIVWVGSLNPPSTPADTMYTLDDVYHRLDKDAGAPASWGLDPSASPDSTMHTIEDIYNKTPDFRTNAGTAVVGDVCNSATFYTNSSSKLIGTRTACSSPGLTKTGQTTSYTNYDDGYYEKGLASSYTDNEDGTITDGNTGLMWKRCTEPDTQTSGCTGTHSIYTWQNAINQCEGLNYPTDVYTDWRLPNAKELWSITSLEPGTAPYIDHTAFPGTISGYYWSATTYPYGTVRALYVDFFDGYLDRGAKTYSYCVRCVRGQ